MLRLNSSLAYTNFTWICTFLLILFKNKFNTDFQIKQFWLYHDCYDTKQTNVDIETNKKNFQNL